MIVEKPGNSNYTLISSNSQKDQSIYTVKKGDRLWNIAKSLFKDPTVPTNESILKTVLLIANKNSIKDPNNIAQGQKLNLPNKGDLDRISLKQAITAWSNNLDSDKIAQYIDHISNDPAVSSLFINKTIKPIADKL